MLPNEADALKSFSYVNTIYTYIAELLPFYNKNQFFWRSAIYKKYIFHFCIKIRLFFYYLYLCYILQINDKPTSAKSFLIIFQQLLPQDMLFKKKMLTFSNVELTMQCNVICIFFKLKSSSYANVLYNINTLIQLFTST